MIQCVFYTESSEYEEYLKQFTSLRIACTQLTKERALLDCCYPQMFGLFYEITNFNTLIGKLLSTSHGGVGILTSLIQLLVGIHNSFIDKYREIFPKKNLR